MIRLANFNSTETWRAPYTMEQPRLMKYKTSNTLCTTGRLGRVGALPLLKPLSIASINGAYLSLRSQTHFSGHSILLTSSGDTCVINTLRGLSVGSNGGRRDIRRGFRDPSTVLYAQSSGQMKSQARLRAAERSQTRLPLQFSRVILGLPAPEATELIPQVASSLHDNASELPDPDGLGILQSERTYPRPGRGGRGRGRPKKGATLTSASDAVQRGSNGGGVGAAASTDEGAPSGGQKGRGQAASTSRGGRKGQIRPRGWRAPPIAPTRCTPPRLRPRSTPNLGTPDSTQLRGHPSRRARIGTSPGGQRGGTTHTQREVEMRAAHCGSPPPYGHTALGSGQANSSGPSEVPPPGNDRRFRNLQGAFDKVARVRDWVPNLANVDNPATQEWESSHIVGEDAILEQPCSKQLGDVALPIPVRTLPCQENGPNNQQGTMLPDGVWVRLQCMGYEPQQWGGLDAFFGNPILAVWDGDIQFFGVQFGGGVGYHLVRVTDCLCLDWRFWPPVLPSRPFPTSDGQFSSAPQGGTTTSNQQAVQSSAMTCGDSVSQGDIQQTEGAMDVTPPRAGRSARTAIDCTNYEELCEYDGWTSDSQDASWMADFRDFAGNSSDDENSDWEMLSVSEGPLGDDIDLDPLAYQEFAHLDRDYREALEQTRVRYADTEWSQDTSILEGNRAEFRGPHPGPTQRFQRRKQPPRYFFDLWWDDVTIRELVSQTNMYAHQQCTNQADPRRRGQPAGLNGGPRWRDTTATEFRAFLGIVILMGSKLCPSIRQYWSRDPFWKCGVIPQVMSRDRFESLFRCLHCVNNSTLCRNKEATDYDKIGKVRWVLDHFVSHSRELFNCEKYITCDEVMIAYRGRFAPIRQYIPAKPTKYGIKCWAAVSNPSRYIYNVIPYLGKSGLEVEVAQGEKVVHQLTRGLGHRSHTVVCDNFFTSPLLFEGLLERGIFGTGTVKGRRVGFPSCLAGMKRGDQPRATLFWQMHKSHKMAATTWFDSKPVSFLSTSANPVGEAIALRWLRGERQEIPTTPQQAEYQMHMRGVDLVDQMRRDYTVQFHSRKWWHKLFFFTLDSSLQNAWILYRHDKRARGEKCTGGRLAFYMAIANSLIEPVMTLPRTCSLNNVHSTAIHYTVKHPDDLRKRCRVCKKRQRRVCKACQWLPVCGSPCFRKLHGQKKWALRLSK